MKDKINRSSIMEIATYIIADYERALPIDSLMSDVLLDLGEFFGKDHPYIQYLHTAIEFDPTIGDIAILRTINSR